MGWLGALVGSSVGATVSVGAGVAVTSGRVGAPLHISHIIVVSSNMP